MTMAWVSRSERRRGRMRPYVYDCWASGSVLYFQNAANTSPKMGDRPRGSDCHPLGRYSLTPISPAASAGMRKARSELDRKTHVATVAAIAAVAGAVSPSLGSRP